MVNGALALPHHLDLSKFGKFWNEVNYTKKLTNSIVISLSVALIAVTLSFMTAYAIGIGRIRGRNWVLAFFMVAFTIPQEAMIYPLYDTAKKIADVNGDGKVDLSITDSRSHFVEILQYRPDSGLKHALYFRIFEQKSFRNEDEGGGTDPRGLRRLCVHL